jgi:glutathione S-transferase
LNIKGIQYKTVWLEFAEVESEIKKLGVPPQPSGSLKYTVPAIYDPATKRAVMDSQEILKYLEEQYPEAGPTLLPPGTRGIQAAFVENFTSNILGAAFPLIVLDVFAQVPETSKKYFRESREGWFGTKLENVALKGDDAQPKLKAIEKILSDVARWIALNGDNALFLSGTSTPLNADVTVASLLVFFVKATGQDSDLTKLILSANGGLFARYLEAFSKWESE